MLSRRDLLLSAAALSAVGLPGASFGQTPPTAGTPPYWSWFKHTDDVGQKWRVEAAPDNANAITIRPRRLAGRPGAQKIMVVYPRPSSAYDIAISKILGVFDDKQLDVELDVMNYQNKDEYGKAVLSRVDRERFDLILSMGSETTAWMWTHYRGGRAPVVTVCSKDPVVLGQSPGYSRGSGTNFAFTSLNMPIDVQMAYVSELKPKLRNIAVLVDSRNFSAIETQAKPVVDYARNRNIRILNLAVQNPADARIELERMVRDATLQMSKNDPDLSNSVYWVTGSTSVFREIATINAHAGRAAVISVVPEIVREGDDSAVLSIGISFESNAHLAAVYAADILKGRAAAGELRVGVVSPPDIAISFRKLRDIGMTIPLSFFEAASTIYDYDGRAVRIDGVSKIVSTRNTIRS